MSNGDLIQGLLDGLKKDIVRGYVESDVGGKDRDWRIDSVESMELLVQKEFVKNQKTSILFLDRSSKRDSETLRFDVLNECTVFVIDTKEDLEEAYEDLALAGIEPENLYCTIGCLELLEGKDVIVIDCLYKIHHSEYHGYFWKAIQLGIKTPGAQFERITKLDSNIMQGIAWMIKDVVDRDGSNVVTEDDIKCINEMVTSDEFNRLLSEIESGNTDSLDEICALLIEAYGEK